MPYYRVSGLIIEEVEEYVEAKNKKEAIKKAEENVGNCFDDDSVERITKEEYENNV